MFYNLPYILEGRDAREDNILTTAISEATFRFGGCYAQVSFGNPAWVKHLFLISSKAISYNYGDVIDQYYHVNVLARKLVKYSKAMNPNGNLSVGSVVCSEFAGVCYMDYIVTDTLPAISYTYKVWSTSYPYSTNFILKCGNEVVVDEAVYKWICLASRVYSKDIPTTEEDQDLLESMAHEIEGAQKDAEYL